MIFNGVYMIPKFSSYFLPFMKSLYKNEICSLGALSKMVSDDLHLSEADMNERTKGGSVTKHKSNINYCAAYLKKMGLIEKVGHGVYKITQKGVDVLQTYGDKLNLSTLRELPEFIFTQYNPNNKDMVLVMPHKKGDKMVGAYYCNKRAISKNNPNLYNPNKEDRVNK